MFFENYRRMFLLLFEKACWGWEWKNFLEK